MAEDDDCEGAKDKLDGVVLTLSSDLKSVHRTDPVAVDHYVRLILKALHPFINVTDNSDGALNGHPIARARGNNEKAASTKPVEQKDLKSMPGELFNYLVLSLMDSRKNYRPEKRDLYADFEREPFANRGYTLGDLAAFSTRLNKLKQLDCLNWTQGKKHAGISLHQGGREHLAKISLEGLARSDDIEWCHQNVSWLSRPSES